MNLEEEKQQQRKKKSDTYLGILIRIKSKGTPPTVRTIQRYAVTCIRRWKKTRKDEERDDRPRHVEVHVRTPIMVWTSPHFTDEQKHTFSYDMFSSTVVNIDRRLVSVPQ